MKKSICLLVLLCLSCTLSLEDKYRRRADPPAEGDAAKGGDATPKQIKIDQVAVLTPEVEVGMNNKPQIIIARKEESKPSEVEHTKLTANDPCNLRQGYVLFQDKLDERSPNAILYTKPSFCVLNKQTISFFSAENIHSLLASYELGDVMANPKENFWLKSNCVVIVKPNPDVKILSKSGNSRRKKGQDFLLRR